jgi:DNA-binding NarL/FixJ family response regulator
MDKVRLLIIDEHDAVRQALTTRLSSTPTIEVVATAQDINSPDFSESGYSDVTLLGLKSSSDMDLDVTIGTVERLTKAGTAVIILTPYADDIERELVLHAGACRYLLKDINSPQLISEIFEVAEEQTKPVA